LKTLEKINTKAIRKSLEKGKTQFSSSRPTKPNPVLTRPRCLIGGPRLSAPTSAPSLPLSLAAPWARLVGAVLSHARPLLSLSHRPHLSARPQPPAHDPPLWTRPRPRVLRPCPHTRTPFEPRALLAHLPSLICTLCQTLLPSLSLCPRTQRAPPPPAVDCCLFCGHCCVRAPYSATVSSALLSAARDTLRCALSLSVLSGPRSPEQSSRSWSPAAVAPLSSWASVVASRLQRFPSR
jgi:hypothetical protein